MCYNEDGDDMDKNKELILDVLKKLDKSSFRSSFHLKQRDLLYIEEKGLDEIKKHAYDFINTRLAPKAISNDGKQTPMRGHPVFIAQHATATCCRGCLYKWHHISKDKALSDNEVNYVVSIIMTWIKKEVKKNNSNRN